MDTLVENTGIAHQEKPTPVHAVNEQSPIGNAAGTAVTLLDGENDGIEAVEQEPAIVIPAAPNEIAAGYGYAFGRR